ncbi:sensor histidine kinase [Planococcus salinus]|uniref:histidine kinase n=1 Tax=Planococcus salinus TaxID=1848460 RepID=A0A3M8P4B7_9BACL|nr:HAMP domain-containing sensor histidine kinase [Planococcus salinus]RNF38503.1 sensor histidine kinase [Planococcus salinus]
MKLKNKIHLSSTLLTLVILLVLTLIIYFAFSRLTYSTEIDRLQTELDSLVTTLNASDSEDPRSILRAYVPVNGLVKVTDSTGELIPPIYDPSITGEFPSGTEGVSGMIDVDGERFGYAKAPVIWTDGEVAEIMMAQSFQAVSQNMRTLRFVLLSAILIGMIPIVISSAALGKIVTQPITDLTQTMTRIQRNGKFEKLPVTGDSQDELAQMGNTFNEMMGLLEENYTKQEEFVSNASHELKTPLTVIGSYARLLERQGMEDEKIAEEGLAAIQAETERMKALIEQLLHLARRTEYQTEMVQVNIVRILEETIGAMKASYDREFLLEAEEPVLTETTDIAKLKQLLYILLDNARKYSEDRIEVVAKKEGATVIQIRDYGIGIPKQSLSHVFERFYRVDKARSRETGGFGLGLALAKQLADSLEVTLEIESVEQLGTTISIIFSSNFNAGGLELSQEGS